MEEKEIIQSTVPEESELEEVQAEAAKSEREISDEREAIEVLKKFTDEDEDDMGEISLRSILGGDILQSRFIRKQVLFIIFCVALVLFYTGNRYQSQQDAITIDSLRTELQKVKYNVLTQSSELMNITRQSYVERVLKQTKDSVLETPITPPYLITGDSLK